MNTATGLLHQLVHVGAWIFLAVLAVVFVMLWLAARGDAHRGRR